MSKIVGMAKSDFIGKEGQKVTGLTLYLGFDLDANRGGQGIGTERIFLSTAKLSKLNFKPELGMAVEALFNKFGKIQTLKLIDDDLELE